MPRLDERLHLGQQVLGRALAALQAEGLAHCGEGGWEPSALGREALERGEYLRTFHEPGLSLSSSAGPIGRRIF